MKDIVKVKIGNHIWKIRFLYEKLMRQGNDGTCWFSKKTIDIDNGMDKEETKLILTHELTHALLANGGRAYETKLDRESICEFVAWNIDEIIRLRDHIMKERYGK